MNFEQLNPDTDNFIGKIEKDRADSYVLAMQDLAVAIMMQNKPAARDARLHLERLTAETMGMGEILGASMVLRASAMIINKNESFAKELGLVRDSHSMHFATSKSAALIPRLSLKEAAQDMVDRTPVTIRAAAERTAQKISEIYDGGRAVVFARSAEASVTKAVQKVIVELMRAGSDEVEAGRRIMKAANDARKRSKRWTEAYARTVFRNNVNTAVTAGRFRQTKDPAIKAILPAKQFNAVIDDVTRDNHYAADGLIWSVDNPIWQYMAPPIGHNCRCSVRDVGVPELRRMGRIGPRGVIYQDDLPNAAGPDDGWRPTGRPDSFLETMFTRDPLGRFV